MIYDISMTIKPEMTVYKNKEDKKPVFLTVNDHIKGTSHETRISMDLHTGTHIDAPLHMIQGGQTIDKFQIERYIGHAEVLDLSHLEAVITKEDLHSFEIQKDVILLLKTKNSFEESFIDDFVFLNQGAAEYLVEKEIKGVGIDALGIERGQTGHETHKALLMNQIFILEGLRLKDVPAGTYQLIALPLKLENVEASPTRAILITT